MLGFALAVRAPSRPLVHVVASLRCHSWRGGESTAFFFGFGRERACSSRSSLVEARGGPWAPMLSRRRRSWRSLRFVYAGGRLAGCRHTARERWLRLAITAICGRNAWSCDVGERSVAFSALAAVSVGCLVWSRVTVVELVELEGFGPRARTGSMRAAWVRPASRLTERERAGPDGLRSGWTAGFGCGAHDRRGFSDHRLGNVLHAVTLRTGLLVGLGGGCGRAERAGCCGHTL